MLNKIQFTQSTLFHARHHTFPLAYICWKRAPENPNSFNAIGGPGKTRKERGRKKEIPFLDFFFLFIPTITCQSPHNGYIEQQQASSHTTPCTDLSNTNFFAEYQWLVVANFFMEHLVAPYGRCRGCVRDLLA